MLTDAPGTSKRLNVNLPASTYEDLQRLAANSNTTMTEILRTALGLVKLAYDETGKDNVLAVATKDGKLLKQILLPK